MHCSFWDVCSITRGTSCLDSLLFLPLISYTTLPVSPLWASDKGIFTNVCSTCFSIQQRPSLPSLFQTSSTSLASVYTPSQLPSVSSVLIWNPLPLFSHFLPEDRCIFLLSANCFCFRVIFPWNSSAWVYFFFPFMIQRIVKQFVLMYLFTPEGQDSFLRLCTSFLSPTCGKTKQNKGKHFCLQTEFSLMSSYTK